MLRTKNILPAFLLLLFAAAVYFPLFLHLDHMSVRLWDEARRAVNAYEMAQNGNLLVTHYGGKPEMWGTKPPLLIWCQAFCMKLLGPTEVAVRLPSALAALGTIAMLVLFCWKVLRRPMAGFLAGLVLVTTPGYVIHGHVARSGDFDSLLTLWETGYLLAFFTFFTHSDPLKRRRWLYIAASFVALAGLTKGVAGFFFLPGLALFYLTSSFGDSGQMSPGSFFRWRHTWLAALLSVGPLALFYLLREASNPGYLAAVMENELAGRYLVAQAMHGHEWWHYLHELWSKQFQYWLPFLPLGLLIGFWRKGQVRHLTALLLVSAACFFIVISIGHTRIVWYMAPVYPSLALLVGIGFERLVSGASQLLSASQAGRLALATVLVFGMFFSPYRQIIQAVYFEKHPKHDWHEVCYRDFMRRVEGVRNYTIVHQFYNSHVAFYAHVFNEKGCTIRHQAMQDFDNNKFEFGNGPLQFAEGDTVMICEEKVLNNLGKAYTYRSLNKWEGCHLLVISGKPPTPAAIH